MSEYYVHPTSIVDDGVEIEAERNTERCIER